MSFWCNTKEMYVEPDDCRDCYDVECESGYANDLGENDNCDYIGDEIELPNDPVGVYECDLDIDHNCDYQKSVKGFYGKSVVICGLRS